MKFDLTTPCGNCPFLRRGGIRLRAGRVREIAEPCLTHGGEGAIFPCHLTAGQGRPRSGWSMCAGSLLFSMNHGVDTQAMQIAERLGIWKPAAMKGHARVFANLRAMLRTAI